MGKTIRQVEFPAPLKVPLRRVAAYARVSTGKDAMLHSLSAQVSYYSKLIQQNPEGCILLTTSNWMYSAKKDGHMRFT